MKRVFAICMVLLCLLAGCTKPQIPPPPPDVPPDPPADTRPTLLKEAAPAGSLGNLWELTMPALEGMEYPQLHLYGDDLLLLETRFDDIGNGHATLKLVDLDTGTVMAETAWDTYGAVQLKVSGTRIGVCDSASGWAKILDGSLQETLNYMQDVTWGDWIFSPDLSTLYQFNWQEGIKRIDLSTGMETLVADAREAFLMDECDGKALISYLDLKDLRVKTSTLNLSTGVLQPLETPFQVGWMMQSSFGSIINDAVYTNRYHLITETSHIVTETFGNCFRMTHETGHIFTLDMESRSPALYNLQGKLVSRFDLPGGEWVQQGGDILWCEQ